MVLVMSFSGRPRTWITAGAALIMAYLPAQDRSTETIIEDVRTIGREYAAAMAAFRNNYDAARDDAERLKIRAAKPRPDAWFPRLYALAKKDPKGKGAEAALVWIASHSQHGTAGDEALELLARNHAAAPGMIELMGALGNIMSVRADECCAAIESSNPSEVIRACALLARAERAHHLWVVADALRHPINANHSNELRGHFTSNELDVLQRLTSDDVAACVNDLLTTARAKYPNAQEPSGESIVERIASDLFEVRNLSIGMVAPEIVGETAQHERGRLSLQRGKVVVLYFWGDWSGSCQDVNEQIQKLGGRYAGRSLAVVGVNSDTDRARAAQAIKGESLTWITWWDGNPRQARITKAWNIRTWPTIYVLDFQGVIRFKNVPVGELETAVGTLISESEGDRPASRVVR
jgi:thiol-disulfide isomerase/thioredoxin